MPTIDHCVRNGIAGPRLLPPERIAALRGLDASLMAAVPRHYPVIVCVIIYLSAAASVSRLVDVQRTLTMRSYAANLTALAEAFMIVLALGLCAHAVHVMLFDRPRRLARHFIADFQCRIFTNERLAQSLLIFLLMPLFVTAYTSFKTSIPQLHPFSWDATFSQWDLWLHGGHHPWRLLQPIIGHPLISSLINVVYNVWFYVVFGVMAWQAASLRDPRLRLQFLLSFVLTWALLGSLAATLLSSAGPVYYGRVTGLEDVYAPLMAYLHAADERYPIWALGVQEMLWTHYQHVIAGAGSGISAMPSMHVGTSVLFTLLGWRAHRLLGLAFAAFTGVILVGSVHLGWHYAVDGYVAIVATCLIWVVVGRALARSADAPGSGWSFASPPLTKSRRRD